MSQDSGHSHDSGHASWEGAGEWQNDVFRNVCARKCLQSRSFGAKISLSDTARAGASFGGGLGRDFRSKTDEKNQQFQETYIRRNPGKSQATSEITKKREFVGFGPPAVQKPYEFVWCSTPAVQNPYEFTWFSTPRSAHLAPAKARAGSWKSRRRWHLRALGTNNQGRPYNSDSTTTDHQYIEYKQLKQIQPMGALRLPELRQRVKCLIGLQ